MAAAVIVLMAAVLVFVVRRPGNPALFPARPAQPTVIIFVTDNGYHSNISVPTQALLRHAGPVGEAARRTPDGPWTDIGFGDARFYVEEGASGARALDGLRALFAPNNPSAVMLEPLTDAPDRLWSTGVTRVTLSQPGFEAMLNRADRSLASADGRASARRGRARFFASREHFSIMHLCNHWTDELLSAAGIPVRPLLGTLGPGVTLDLRQSGAGVDTARHGR